MSILGNVRGMHNIHHKLLKQSLNECIRNAHRRRAFLLREHSRLQLQARFHHLSNWTTERSIDIYHELRRRVRQRLVKKVENLLIHQRGIIQTGDGGQSVMRTESDNIESPSQQRLLIDDVPDHNHQPLQNEHHDSADIWQDAEDRGADDTAHGSNNHQLLQKEDQCAIDIWGDIWFDAEDWRHEEDTNRSNIHQLLRSEREDSDETWLDAKSRRDDNDGGGGNGGGGDTDNEGGGHKDNDGGGDEDDDGGDMDADDTGCSSNELLQTEVFRDDITVSTHHSFGDIKHSEFVAKDKASLIADQTMNQLARTSETMDHATARRRFPLDSHVHCDKTYAFPRESLNGLAELGLLGLLVPKELGGLEESHVCAAMVVETIARYGCPSTAMIYTMHSTAVAVLLHRYHDNETIKDLLRRLDKDKLVGTLSYSDPATGGHFWFPLSSKCRQVDADHVKVLKYGSWATSAGFADWYAIQTVSPGAKPGDFTDLSCFLLFKDEVRANANDWSSLGMRGNQSGPLICEGVLTNDRRIGPIGDGTTSNDECVITFFLLFSSACWNGISMACMDLVKKHVTRKAHGDVGMRVADYPTIQDYFGESICDTNSCRLMNVAMAQALDKATDNNNWSKFTDHKHKPRAQFAPWLWQMKFVAAKNVSHVTDQMLHASGGSGYKCDLGLERLLRDGKAGWVMSLSNEVIRQLVGQAVLLGFEALDLWQQKVNHRTVHHELKKMTPEEKEALAHSLLEDVNNARIGAEQAKQNQEDEDFENPFSTAPPTYVDKTLTLNDKACTPGLHPEKYTPMTLKKRTPIGENIEQFDFTFPQPSKHLGCLPGQYVKVRITPEGYPVQERYFSPVSRPDQPDVLQLIVKFETAGILSQHFRVMKTGDIVEVMGPCGGFEYRPNTVDHLSLIASGAGVTPTLQLIRSIMADKTDNTHIHLLYYSECIDDVLLKDELDHYRDTDPRLKILYSLGETPENWEGEEGFIDTEMIEKNVPKPNGRRCKIVLCGGPTMIVSSLASLRQLKFSARDLFIYGQFGAEHVRMIYGRNVQLSGHTSDCAI